MPLLFLLFILVPITEMWILIEVGGRIGALNTIGLVLLTAVIGASMLRQQGLQTLSRAQQRMNSGELPAQEMLEGLALAFGGALLLTPGFVTDTIGFLCLIPPTRAAIVAALLRRGIVQTLGSGTQGGFHHGGFGQGGFDPHSEPQAGPSEGRPRGPRVEEHGDGNVTIEGDFRRED